MYIVTGGAGMIGSALIWELNRRGIAEILVVDHLGSSEKWRNLSKLRYLAYLPKEVFAEHLRQDTLEEILAAESVYGKTPGRIQGIAHLGACSSTTELDADYMLQNNLEYSKALCIYAQSRGIRYIQASSAATYGGGEHGFSDSPENLDRLRPLNIYGYSKHLFDLWARRTGRLNSLASLKFFNVYGPNEYHKGEMRSMVLKAVEQIRDQGFVRLFRSYKKEYPDGGQLRDFIYVKDCAIILADLLERPGTNGLFNLGTGQARSWRDLACAVFAAMALEPRIEYVDMPEVLRGKYQYFTQADMDSLSRAMGPGRPLPRALEEGVLDYVQNYLTGEDGYL